MTGARQFLHVFPTFDPGGSQVRAVQLMGMLQEQDLSVRHNILAMDGRTGCADLIPDGVSFDLLPPPAQLGFFAMGKNLANLLREQQPDLVLTYNWGAIETVLGRNRLGDLPLVHHEDGFGPEETDRLLWRRVMVRRWLLRTAGAVVVPSKTLEDIARRRWRLPADKVRYLPNGVDLQRFVMHANEPGQAGHEPSHEPVVGHVGQFRGEKNQALLLEAFAACKHRHHAHLLLWGDGPEASNLSRLTTRLGIEDRVTFEGVTDDTSTIYRDMDIFALSSRTEQMPLTVLEAMGCGLPVVSTDVGDVRRMVAVENANPDAGLIVPRDDVPALAGAIDKLVGDAYMRGRIGRANRERAEQQYDMGRCYQRYLDLYMQLAIPVTV